jgi:uncharacterized damage-inducible protein DinB
MPMIDAYVAELDHEAATTRRLLERMPAGRADWKPHERSMTLGRLCGHIAELPIWGTVILRDDAFDMATAAERGYPPPYVAADRGDLLARFDRELGEMLSAARGVGDERLAEPWSLARGDETLFTLPRAVALRRWVLNHLVHHRGQLSVYLRLLDVPLPSIYGPSADEEAPARG